MRFDFGGRSVLVTGAGSGIGLATAQLFLELGATVVGVDRAFSPATDSRITQLLCDVADESSLVASLAACPIPSWDFLVVAAGIHVSGSLLDSTESQIRDCMGSNLFGAIATLRAVLPRMSAGGAVVLVASDQSLVAKPSNAVYGASKAAMAHLARSTAVDMASKGIRANALCVGSIDTPLLQDAVDRLVKRKQVSRSAVLADLAAKQLVGRIGRPQEVAHAAAFLCSEYASYFNGALIPLDGGYTCV